MALNMSSLTGGSAKKNKQARTSKTLENQLERQGKPDSLKEQVISPFTEIPKYLIESLFAPAGSGKSPEQGENKPQNFTDLNEAAVKQQLEASFEDQENSPQKLADARRFLQNVQEEQKQAQLHFEEKKKKKEKEEEEEKLIKEQDEQKKKEAAAQGDEPQTKQKRGMLFGTKKKKKEYTPETKVSFGKN